MTATPTAQADAQDLGMRGTVPILAAALLLLAGCGPNEVILPGERLDVSAALDGAPEAAAPEGPRPIALPAQVAHPEWTHKAGAPDHSIQHPALGPALRRVWSADLGRAADRRHRITADPVVAGGRVFALDSRARVSAFSTGGARLWSQSLTPPADGADDASGGGLAVGAGRLFVTTGFGTLVALDPATGRELWTQDLDAAVTGAPTVVGDTVYAVSRDSRGWALDAATGRIRWQHSGLPSPAGVDGGAAPAIGGRLALFPMNSGELVAAAAEGGTRLWTAPVVGRRLGAAYATLDDITGDPVIVGESIYVGNPSGRTVALDAATGERRWTVEEGAMSPPWVTGGSVFIVTDRNELVRLDAATGQRVWGTPLPYYQRTRPNRRKAAWAHYGPVLAGGRLLVASDDGHLRGFDPVSGRLIATTELPGGASSNPVVAGRTLYVVSQTGRLHAYR